MLAQGVLVLGGAGSGGADAGSAGFGGADAGGADIGAATAVAAVAAAAAAAVAAAAEVTVVIANDCTSSLWSSFPFDRPLTLIPCLRSHVSSPGLVFGSFSSSITSVSSSASFPISCLHSLATFLKYATHLVDAPTARPQSVRGGTSLGCDALEDRQFELALLVTDAPHLCAMLLSLKGDPDAVDIMTPCTYSEAVSHEWAC
ncbi:unnamed protein product [Closterium sp. NIES-53]